MIVVLATIKIKPGSEEAFVGIAKRMAEAVKTEPGCVSYELLKTDSPTTYAFLERYRDDEAVAAHRKADHFRTIGREMGEHMDGKPEIVRLATLD